MALTGLDIYKLLPKGNCKKCGMPTCLAFAMQLAQKRTELEKCPEVSEEAKQKLAAAAAPPIRLVTFGQGANKVQIGQETVLYRHEEKFYNPTVMAVTVSDSLEGDALTQRIEAVNALQFDRVGQHIAVNAIAVKNDSKSVASFAAAAEAVQKNSPLAIILLTDSAQAMAAALEKTAAAKPLLAGVGLDSCDAMAKLAKEKACPLAVKASSLEDLAELTEKVQAQGVEDIVLNLDGLSLKDQVHGLSRIRTLALKKGFRPLGYPTLALACEGSTDQQTARATSLICKYGSVVVMETVEPAAYLSLLTVVSNVFSDPQKPIQVEPKLYAIGEPDENAPLLFTTNFSLTYYTVESDVEASRVPAYVLVVDTEGTSVLTAYSGDKLNEKAVSAAIKKFEVEKTIKHRKMIIPGYVAVMSGKVEEATGWEVMVGPRESSMIPKYLQEVWSA